MHINNWRQAERAAALWMQLMRYDDAHADATAGADGGVDVVSERAVAQVKHRRKPTGLPDVQRHYGIAVAQHRAPLFFSLSGYSAPAIEFATEQHMALFSYTRSGTLHAVTRPATALIRTIDPEGFDRAQKRRQRRQQITYACVIAACLAAVVVPIVLGVPWQLILILLLSLVSVAARL